jgi:DNA-binding NarL/FixJ family response regulator
MNGLMKRIILVDDHELIREGISELVGQIAVYDVIEQASNDQEGLKLVEALRPDIILMDVGMQVMNGLEATLQIKRHYNTVKVIVLTKHG